VCLEEQFQSDSDVNGIFQKLNHGLKRTDPSAEAYRWSMQFLRRSAVNEGRVSRLIRNMSHPLVSALTFLFRFFPERKHIPFA
jgi:hypothetical protein